MRWMDNERAALVATLRDSDPGAPTLCAGWDVRRMLAHLVQREHSPLNQLQDVLAKPLPGHEPRLGAVVFGAETAAGYQALITRFAAGTGPLNPMTWFGDSVQLIEYVIHHEDIRRGTGDAEPRLIPAGLGDAIWRRLPLMAKMMFRSAPVGVGIQVPGGEIVTVHKGQDAVVLTGDPVEIALYVMGRRSAAHVELGGSPHAVAAFTQWAEKSS